MGLPFLWLLLLLSPTPAAYLPPSTSKPLSALAPPTSHSRFFTREMADDPDPGQAHPAPVVINAELKPLCLGPAGSACLQPCPWAKTKDLYRAQPRIRLARVTGFRPCSPPMQNSLC